MCLSYVNERWKIQIDVNFTPGKQVDCLNGAAQTGLVQAYFCDSTRASLNISAFRRISLEAQKRLWFAGATQTKSRE